MVVYAKLRHLAFFTTTPVVYIWACAGNMEHLCFHKRERESHSISIQVEKSFLQNERGI